MELACTYFPAHKMHQPIRYTVIFLLEILEKYDDECILILVIYWKKTGLSHTKISNHNIIYSTQKPRKSSSLPLKSYSWLFSLDAFKFGNNTYPRRIRRRSNLGHIFRGEGKVRLMGREIQYLLPYETSPSQSTSSSSITHSFSFHLNIILLEV